MFSDTNLFLFVPGCHVQQNPTKLELSFGWRTFNLARLRAKTKLQDADDMQTQPSGILQPRDDYPDKDHSLPCHCLIKFNLCLRDLDVVPL